MYVGKEEIDLILAFIGGMELRTKFKLKFGSDLICYIFDKYTNSIEIQELKSNLNYYTLKEQLIKLKELNGETEIQNFKSESIEFLVFISDQKLNGIFKSSLKTDLIKSLQKNVNSKNELFTNTFKGSSTDEIIRLFEEWPGKNLSSEQLEILKSIKKINSNRSLKWLKHKNGEIDDKTDLRLKSKELLKKITRDNK